MKALILGAKGMLGQELYKHFLEHQHEVVGLDLEDIDITDEKKLRTVILEINPNIVLNAVAINAVDRIEDTPEIYNQALKVNAEAVGSLAKICKEKNIVIVHYSSDYVFSGTNKEGYAETAATEPLNKYGETKALGENFLRQNTDQFYLIRLSKLFGRPASSQGAKKSFVDLIIGLASEGHRDHFDFVDEEYSSPTYAPDLAKTTLALVEESRPFGIYHAANSGACTWYEWAREIFRLKNINIKIFPITMDQMPRPASRPRFSELKNTKLPAIRPWQEALKEYLQN